MANDFARGTSATLTDFTNFIQLTMESGEIIADETTFVTGERAVNLLTVHKAKGLEFDSVHIINAIDNSWRPSSGGRKYPANLPLQPVGDDQDDYARLMYVAATRAKRNLTAHSFREDIQGKEVMATPLLAEVLELVPVPTKLDPIVVLEEHLTWPHLNTLDEKRNLQGQLENFSLSATALLDFLDISRGGPEYFFERHLLRLPSSKTANMGFGIAMHTALEYAQIATNNGALVQKKVLDHYQQALAEQFLPAHDYERFLAHGQELLQKLLGSETFWLAKGDIPEQSLGDVRVGEAIIKGAIDRIHKQDNQITIIDYKTGKPLGSFVTRDQTKALKAWRHRMQLIFYALLVQQSPRFNAAEITGQMWYLEAASPKELIREYLPSSTELTRMSQLIQVIWPKIQELNLPDISNYTSDYSGIQAFEQDLLDGNI